jgi:hypothetical protein
MVSNYGLDNRNSILGRSGVSFVRLFVRICPFKPSILGSFLEIELTELVAEHSLPSQTEAKNVSNYTYTHYIACVWKLMLNFEQRYLCLISSYTVQLLKDLKHMTPSGLRLFNATNIFSFNFHVLVSSI